MWRIVVKLIELIFWLLNNWLVHFWYGKCWSLCLNSCKWFIIVRCNISYLWFCVFLLLTRAWWLKLNDLKPLSISFFVVTSFPIVHINRYCFIYRLAIDLSQFEYFYLRFWARHLSNYWVSFFNSEFQRFPNWIWRLSFKIFISRRWRWLTLFFILIIFLSWTRRSILQSLSSFLLFLNFPLWFFNFGYFTTLPKCEKVKFLMLMSQWWYDT